VQKLPVEKRLFESWDEDSWLNDWIFEHALPAIVSKNQTGADVTDGRLCNAG